MIPMLEARPDSELRRCRGVANNTWIEEEKIDGFYLQIRTIYRWIYDLPTKLKEKKLQKNWEDSGYLEEVGRLQL